MKKRFLAFLLALSIAASLLVMPASAAGSNAAVQAAVALGGMTTEQAAQPDTPLTRGQLARLLTAFSSYRESVSAQGSTGTLFSDVNSSSAYGPYIRVAVQQSWLSGYLDGSFRPDNAVTLEEASTAVLKLLGYDVTALSGTFPAAQLNKASSLGLRSGISASQGSVLTLAEGARLVYNALTASTKDGQVYGSTIGFPVTDGQVDIASIVMDSVEGPFVAGESTVLPFVPVSVYRNDSVVSSADLSAYDVYYYSESARTLWVYSRRAAGRITAVSPTASAPASVTVAGTIYTIGSSSAAATLSSLNGGGVGQVVTLLLGMNDEVVSVLTGDEADAVFYGVVQSSSRSLTEENGADVQQAVTVICTDGTARTVHVDKSLNYLAGTLVEVSVDADGESVEKLDSRSTSGTISADASALGSIPLAENAEILDTTSEGVAGTVVPSRLSGVTLSDSDVRYYTTNEKGQIDRLILSNVTGDLYTYAVLDDVKNLTTTVGDKIDSEVKSSLTDSDSNTTTTTTTTKSDGQIVSDVKDIVLPTTSEILWGIVDGSIGTTLWQSLTSSTGSLASYALNLAADNTSGAVSNVLSWVAKGATYSCYVKGQAVSYQTSVKYPVLAGGIAVSTSPSGKVKSMVQLMPTNIDKLGAAYALHGDTRYELADDMQVYLWYKGQYYATTLAQVNAEDYHLIGWYDDLGCAAGKKIRVLIAVKND